MSRKALAISGVLLFIILLALMLKPLADPWLELRVPGEVSMRFVRWVGNEPDLVWSNLLTAEAKRVTKPIDFTGFEQVADAFRVSPLAPPTAEPDVIVEEIGVQIRGQDKRIRLYLKKGLTGLRVAYVDLLEVVP